MNEADSLFDNPLEPPFYNETHVAWRDTLRRFVEEALAPHVSEWDEGGDVPMDVHRRCAEFGLTGLGYPDQYGGYTEGIDLFHAVISAQELARLGAGGVTTALTTHVIGLPPVLAGGSGVLKQRVAPEVIGGRKIVALAITEPDAGSDVANLQTRAVRKGDCYVVNGAKTYISGGEKADFLTVAVRTADGGADGVSLLLLEKGMPGFTTTRLQKQGWWASDTATLYFDGVEVPLENRIGEENQGFRLIMNNFNTERLWMAAGAISYARVCLEEATRWAQTRRTFGKRLADHQVIRHKIVEMYRQVCASQAFLEKCTWGLQQGKKMPADIAMLKVQGSLTMEYCAREASQILGGASFMRGGKVERIYREVRVNAIGGGSEEIMRDLAARQLGIQP